MSKESQQNTQEIDPYQTPLKDASLTESRLAAIILAERKGPPLPNEVQLGDIPSMKVAGIRAASLTLVAGGVLLGMMTGLDSIWMVIIRFLVLVTWAIFVIIFIIAIFQQVIKSMSRS
jgi:hypothetical protein